MTLRTATLPATDRATTDRPITDRPATDRPGVVPHAGVNRWRIGIAPCFAAYFLGSIAQGAPFVIVAAALERQHVGSGWLAAVAAARLAPYLVCSPMAGAVAGRYGARQVFAISGLMRGALIAALGISVGIGAPAGVLLVVLLVLVAVGAPGFPALMRLVRHLAEPQQLDRTSTLAAGIESAAFCAGPALGGFLVLTGVGAVSSLLVCTALMLASAAVARGLASVQAPPSRSGSPPDQRIRTAGRHLLDRGIRPAVVAVLGINVLAGIDAALLVRVPAGLGLGDERAFGLLSLAHGFGAAAAFIVLVGPMRRRRGPLLPLVTASGAVAALAATSRLSVALVACVVLGASILTSEAVVTSALGSSLPAPLVAPAFGVLDALMIAAMIAGAALAPLLAMAVGLRWSLAIAGVVTPLLAIGALRQRSTTPDERGETP